MRKFELKIFHADQTIYWEQGFDSEAELEKWLAEEQTRPYWRKDFIVEKTDNSLQVEQEKEAERVKAEEAFQKQVDLKAEILEIKNKKNKTLEDLSEGFEKLLELMGV